MSTPILKLDIEGLGARLKQQRLALGLTQEGMAMATGVTRLTQLKHEAGTTTPSLNYLSKAAQNCGVDLWFILAGESTATAPTANDRWGKTDPRRE